MEELQEDEDNGELVLKFKEADEDPEASFKSDAKDEGDEKNEILAPFNDDEIEPDRKLSVVNKERSVLMNLRQIKPLTKVTMNCSDSLSTCNGALGSHSLGGLPFLLRPNRFRSW